MIEIIILNEVLVKKFVTEYMYSVKLVFFFMSFYNTFNGVNLKLFAFSS
jgi:hypothetical protein